jgi:hypothetical protein
MKARLRLARIFGIEIGLHLSWVIIGLLITLSLSSQFHELNPDWGEGTGSSGSWCGEASRSEDDLLFTLKERET